MCGLAGFVGIGTSSDIDCMTRTLAHRGPDGHATYRNDEHRLFLGHTRLAILDIEGGAQPMWSQDGQIGVIYNGEIYNHAALRIKLTAAGHRFRTSHSDTEVLIHGYREWGDEVVHHLDGMFAFGIVDLERKRLFLARDRMGEKPLYYYRAPGLFAFASEPSALFAHRSITRSFDSGGVQKFFAYGYSAGQSTVFRGVAKLRAGESLIFRFDSNETALDRYYTFRLEPDQSLERRPISELAEELRELLLESVKRRLEADVPIGIFLSGGIDSSALLAMAAHCKSSDELRAFTIGFREKSFDETDFACDMASRIGCAHSVHESSPDESRELLGSLFWRLGEPFGDPSIIPTAILSRFARKDVTVALSGDGGDELFAGYDPLYAVRPATIYERWIPPFLHNGLRSVVGALPISGHNMSFEFRIKRLLRGLSYSEQIRLAAWMSAMEPDDVREFFSDPLPIEDLYSETIDVWNSNVTGDNIDRALEFFTCIYLPDDILTKTDRASMLHGLEVRSVFLSRDVVNFARRLPRKFKFQRGQTKVLLRKALEGLIPDRIIRRKKKGFGIPLASWLREFSMPHPDERLHVDSSKLMERWQRHAAGKGDERLLLWSWISLQKCAQMNQTKSLPIICTDSASAS